MSEAIVVALITGAFAVISQLFIAKANARELIAKIDKQSAVADENMKGQIAVVKKDIENLSAKVEKHNQLVERMYRVEERASVLEQKISRLN